MASSTCTPRLEPKSSCHSSTTITLRCLKFFTWSFVLNKTCKLSGVVTKPKEGFLFCFARSLCEVSPVLKLTFKAGERSSVMRWVACCISTANARRGVIHKACNPTGCFSCCRASCIIPPQSA